MEASLNLCAGELVEVRSKEEILATLDPNGRYENMPFMPEMLQYCGRRMRVYKRAHKTCDFVTNTGIRSLPNSVHLIGSRCDGAAHGGCQAQCMIYWKEAWLRRVPQDGTAASPTPAAQAASAKRSKGCTEAAVMAAATSTAPGAPEPVYVCQATLLPQFTQNLSPWKLSAYVEDYRSGNHPSVGKMIPAFVFRAYDNLINLGIGWGPILRWVYDAFQKLHGGLPYPGRSGTIPAGTKTPTGSTGLQPGELVRVKNYDDILKTLDGAMKNRGMGFSSEMAPYCGKVMRVQSRVTRIIDEKTGKMIPMKSPCIILEGSYCQARYTEGMILCPRATLAYWREIWLERVNDPAAEEFASGPDVVTTSLGPMPAVSSEEEPVAVGSCANHGGPE